MTETIKVLESSRTTALGGGRMTRTPDSNNKRLFVGSLPKDKNQADVLTAMTSLCKGVVDVIMYPSQQDRNKNRGYAFVEFASHEAAVAARDEMQAKPPKLWGAAEIKVDWAEPENEVDDETMSKVKVLFVRNLSMGTTEETLRLIFSSYGTVERVKKQTDYAFVHYCDRKDAEAAIKAKNNTTIEGCLIEVMWSKPVKNRELYRQRRGDRTQPSSILPYHLNQFRYISSHSLQPYQLLFHQQLQQQHQQQQQQQGYHQPQLLAAATENPGLPFSMLQGFPNYVPQPTIGFHAAAAALQHQQQHQQTGQQHQQIGQQHQQIGQQAAQQQEGFPVEDNSSRSAQFVQSLGNAPGAVRASISPQVQSRPYPIPSATMQHLQQQQQLQHHLLQQQQLHQPLNAATAQHLYPHIQQTHQYIATAGFELTTLNGTPYPAAFAMYPSGTPVSYFVPPPSQDHYRPHYAEQ